MAQSGGAAEDVASVSVAHYSDFPSDTPSNHKTKEPISAKITLERFFLGGGITVAAVWTMTHAQDENPLFLALIGYARYDGARRIGQPSTVGKLRV